MITYNRDKKKLVIPDGIGQSAGGTGKDYVGGENIDIEGNVINCTIPIENYGTLEYIDAEIQEVEGKIPSLDGYATTGYVDTKFEEVEEEIPDVSNLATKEEVEAVEAKIPDVSGLATQEYVDTQIAEVEEKIPDVSNLATKAELEAFGTEVGEALESKADKADIPSIEGLASETWVESKGYLTEHQQLKTINSQSIVGEGNIDVVKNINNVTGIWSGTREEYDAIEVKDNNTIYIIKS